MSKYIATIQILLEVNTESEACDAIAETMRPLLQEFGGECFIDWKYAIDPAKATEQEIAEFEYNKV